MQGRLVENMQRRFGELCLTNVASAYHHQFAISKIRRPRLDIEKIVASGKAYITEKVQALRKTQASERPDGHRNGWGLWKITDLGKEPSLGRAQTSEKLQLPGKAELRTVKVPVLVR